MTASRPSLRSSRSPTTAGNASTAPTPRRPSRETGTGARRGEILGLRWGEVDLDGDWLRIERSIEETGKRVLRFKSPKTARGRRAVSLPASTVEALKAHRRRQLELRLALGLGRPDG